MLAHSVRSLSPIPISRPRPAFVPATTIPKCQAKAIQSMELFSWRPNERRLDVWPFVLAYLGLPVIKVLGYMVSWRHSYSPGRAIPPSSTPGPGTP